MLERMDAIFLTGQVLKGKSSNFGKNVIITFQRAFLFNATIEQSYTLLYPYTVIHYLFVLLPKMSTRKRINTYITNIVAIIVSIKTQYCKIGIGLPIFIKHAIVCFEAIALITNGNVNAA